MSCGQCVGIIGGFVAGWLFRACGSGIPSVGWAVIV